MQNLRLFFSERVLIIAEIFGPVQHAPPTGCMNSDAEGTIFYLILPVTLKETYVSFDCCCIAFHY